MILSLIVRCYVWQQVACTLRRRRRRRPDGLVGFDHHRRYAVRQSRYLKRTKTVCLFNTGAGKLCECRTPLTAASIGRSIDLVGVTFMFSLFELLTRIANSTLFMRRASNGVQSLAYSPKLTICFCKKTKPKTTQKKKKTHIHTVTRLKSIRHTADDRLFTLSVTRSKRL